MSDAYSIDTIDDLLKLLDRGEFYDLVMAENADLIQELRNYQLAHGGKPKGELTLKIGYQLQKSGDVQITGDVKVKRPEQPKALGAAYSEDDGHLTLFSPMMKKMDVRDAKPTTPKLIK